MIATHHQQVVFRGGHTFCTIKFSSTLSGIRCRCPSFNNRNKVVVTFSKTLRTNNNYHGYVHERSQRTKMGFIHRMMTSSSLYSLNNPTEGESAFLFRGLDKHTVLAEDDNHPLAVYTIHHDDDQNNQNNIPRTPVLLLHGRTWSSLPVYHLIGAINHGFGRKSSNSHNRRHHNTIRDKVSESITKVIDEDNVEENRSLIQALYNTRHIQPYAMDFRGFGNTPRSSCGAIIDPLQCVSDTISVLKWISRRHDQIGDDHGIPGVGLSSSSSSSTTTLAGKETFPRPALLGWSHGALIAQITAQRHPELISKLILYGSIYNPSIMNVIPHRNDSLRTVPNNNGGGHTDYDDFPLHEMAARNEYDGAMEDFTRIGSCSIRGDSTTATTSDDEANSTFPPVSRLFAKVALVCDPIKVQWQSLHQLAECDPSLVKVPTLVISGDQDPYAPISTQADLFANLGRGVDKTWTIVANADHAVHLSDERHRFVANVTSFLCTPL